MKNPHAVRFPSLLTLAVALLAVPAGAQTFDVVIVNGRVLDGSGNPFVYADVGILGDEIVALGNLEGTSARRVIDADGQYVTPGFIGLHEHVAGYFGPGILNGHNRVENYTTQGFTTAVINTDGFRSIWPLTAQRDSLEKLGHSLNLVPMVGHGGVREMVMGTSPEEVMRHATEEELERMRALVRQGMEDGAFGLSTGLEYTPMRYSSEHEVRELAKEVAPYGGFFMAHMRSQGRYSKWLLPTQMEHPTQTHVDWLDAIVEILDVAKAAEIPVMIDHIHPKGPREWGVSKATTQMIDGMWEDGYQVYINMHSYEGYAAYVTLVPRWALIRGEVPGQSAADDFPPVDYTGMLDNLRARLDDPEIREKIRIDAEYETIRQGGADRLLIVGFSDPAYIGKTLAQVAEERGEDVFDTIIWLQMNGLDVPGGVLWMAQAVGMVDIEEWMRQDYTAVALDRMADDGGPAGPSTHPGQYGTSGRLLREFVFERGTITLPHAVRSLTGLAAQILGLDDRGRIAVGQKADIVVFDPLTVRSDATYLNPRVFQVGMNFVLVNGRFVVDEGQPTTELPGVVLDRQREGRAQRPRTEEEAPAGAR